jgi:hypothetical protein
LLSAFSYCRHIRYNFNVANGRAKKNDPDKYLVLEFAKEEANLSNPPDVAIKFHPRTIAPLVQPTFDSDSSDSSEDTEEIDKKKAKKRKVTTKPQKDTGLVKRAKK